MTDRRILPAAISTALLALSLDAASQDGPDITLPVLYEEVLVTGGKDAIRSTAGSATLLDQEAIAKFDATDLNELLAQIPGVYIRFEDGYGLRPNIGIRGATSERSQKITLMEDGILIAPAPYSAPAAYYIPNVNRMAAVEVFKGPAAIQYGPHTVGGALNMATPTVPEQQQGEIDVAVGSDGYRKARVVYGNRLGQWGFNIDALTYGADGFKELDSGGDTGFTRNDINLRVDWRSGPDARFDQQLDLKLGYADEDSDETYLGLTDEDFERNPNRRYVGSELDQFQSEHQQLHALHSIEFAEGLSLFTTAYINEFDRSWNKFDGFFDGTSPSLVLAFPNIFIDKMALLRGEQFSNPEDEDTFLDVTNNDRQYGSHGIETRLRYSLQAGNVEHQLEGGLRFHHDYVERDHKVRGYLVTADGLQSDGQGERFKKALNEAQTDAWSAYMTDAISVGNWKINLGVRTERIDGQFDDFLNDSSNNNSTTVVLPGAGVFYQLTDTWGLLAGVNKGFSPAGPSAADGVDPEESVNYEYGVRFTSDALQADLIGFFSDYSNLLGRCRASDSGCQVGDEFNGGEVEISGAEFTLSWAGGYYNGLSFPVNVTYTFTESAFQNSFLSDFSQWGLVRAGDELPYTPEQQGRIQAGIAATNWNLDLAVRYIGRMREVPGQDGYDLRTSTRALTTLSLAANYALSDQLSIRLVGENLTDEREIVSRRPFGARPNTPRLMRLGLTYRF